MHSKPLTQEELAVSMWTFRNSSMQRPTAAKGMQQSPNTANYTNNHLYWMTIKRLTDDIKVTISLAASQSELWAQ